MIAIDYKCVLVCFSISTNLSQGHSLALTGEVNLDKQSSDSTAEEMTLPYITHVPYHSVAIPCWLEKAVLRGFGLGPTQTGLYSLRRWVEA